ncbi:MAG TPA: 1-acyl-sn-glycerol-3-phosphate acyltransferase [Microscillaceae bacterium]|jgi:1-acyl-sn-glycerol-3-phosphate acyltransferase|nr:1-acyl-sn-glycerol-3-phosphate acyltransferase [Microscillaceae bacterium]
MKINKLQIILGWLTSPLFLLIFGTLLVVFDILQRIALNLFGYQVHKRVVDAFQICFITAQYLCGTTIRVVNLNKNPLPTDRPLIIVGNHQSLFDIPYSIWFLRRHHVKFVAKKELGKGVPTISYNLRYGGSVLIDRKDNVQALGEIAKLGQYIEKHNRAALIYPEGTRSRTGVLKPFKPAGLITLIQNAPSALVLPVTIENSWKLTYYGFFPIPFGVACTYTMLEVIDPQELSPEEVVNQCEIAIRKALKQEQPAGTPTSA